MNPSRNRRHAAAGPAVKPAPRLPEPSQAFFSELSKVHQQKHVFPLDMLAVAKSLTQQGS